MHRHTHAGVCFGVLTCFLRSLEICCSTMVISLSTRSMFCISSSFEKRAGTKSKSGSMCTGLTGEIGSSFPMALPRSCRITSEVLSFKITALCIFRSQNRNNKFSFIRDNDEDWGKVVCQASFGWIWGYFFLKPQPSSSCAEVKWGRGSAWYSTWEMKRVETHCCLLCISYKEDKDWQHCLLDENRNNSVQNPLLVCADEGSASFHTPLKCTVLLLTHKWMEIFILTNYITVLDSIFMWI